MRLPFDQLLPWLQDPDACPEAVLALAVGGQTTYRQVWNWRAKGLNQDQADRAAFALGVHPVEVWGNDYYGAVVGHETVRENARERRRLRAWSPPEPEPFDRFCGKRLSYAWGVR